MKCDTATVCRAPVVNASKQTTVICATTHCATLDKAILPANKQTCSKIVAGLARSLLLLFCKIRATNQGEQSYLYVEPELQSPKSYISHKDDFGH